MTDKTKKSEKLGKFERFGLVMTKIIIGANVAKYAYEALRDVPAHFSASGVISIILLSVTACIVYMLFTALMGAIYSRILSIPDSSAAEKKEKRIWIVIFLIGLAVTIVL